MTDEIRLSEHPRASDQIAAAKAWGALIGFFVVGIVAWKAGLAPFDVGVRALLGGIGGRVLAWAAAVQIWRHLAVAEARANALEHQRRAQARAEQLRGESGDTAIIRGGVS